MMRTAIIAIWFMASWAMRIDCLGQETIVPHIIRFSGTLETSEQEPDSSVVGVTFALFKDEEGGVPLWLETQNLRLDKGGHYTVRLGAMHVDGVPLDIFSSAEARWLGIFFDGHWLASRILLASVPYALKSADAEMLAGRPAKDFVLATDLSAYLAPVSLPSTSCPTCSTATPGQTRALSFESLTPVGPSFISDAMSGPPIQVRSSELVSNLNVDLLQGFAASAFAQVKTGNQFGPVQVFNAGISLAGALPTTTASQTSPPLDFKARVYDRSARSFSDQVFRWQAEPMIDGKGGPAARLNLLFGGNGKNPSETGLSFNSDGTLNFAANQNFPATPVPANAVLDILNSSTKLPGVPALPVIYSTAYQWQQNEGGSIRPGPNTITMQKCPAGVVAGEGAFFVYITGTAAPEAVEVTGGTCHGDGKPGTLEFTAVNAHPGGYVISSASSGVQEALIAARFTPTNPTGTSQSGSVVVPPGEYQAYAPIAIRGSNMTVDFSGSIIECYTAASCIFVGDPSNSNEFEDITLVNPRGRPMVPNGTKPFIEVNAQKTRITNIATRVSPRPNSFGTYVQVDNDQAFLLDGLDAGLGGGGVRCDSVFCGAYVTAPGPFATWAAVGWLKNLNLGLQCTGNGVDWQSGNTLKISDSVIEGYAQFGVRAGTRRGGYGGFELDNVYEEVGGCTNPSGQIGEAGVISQGSAVKITGGEGPTGLIPMFANTGATEYHYYIVAKSALFGASNPLLAGTALTNGVGNIAVTWPDITGASGFDLLRVTTVPDMREQAPYGSGPYLVVTNVPRSSACAKSVCSFVDAQAVLQTYTVASPTYFPLLDFWPGNLVLGTNQDSGSVLDGATATMDSATSDIVAVQGAAAPAVTANTCNATGDWTPIWVSGCLSTMAPSTFYAQGALVLAVKPNTDGGQLTNLKGRLNFSTLGTAPGHIITLSDSNFQKTVATANNRPTNDPNDAFIGYDQGDGNPAHIGISFGAPQSISEYVGNVGDGLNWLERLTATGKEFKTDVKINGNLIVTGSCTGCAALSQSTATSQSSVEVGPVANRPSWTDGPAAPTGRCRPGGLYSRTGAELGNTLYVCEQGNWVGK